MIHAENTQVIDRSKFAVDLGMILEISIVMRRKTAFQDYRCPRCGYLNMNAANNGWVEWQALYKIIQIFFLVIFILVVDAPGNFKFQSKTTVMGRAKVVLRRNS